MANRSFEPEAEKVGMLIGQKVVLAFAICACTLTQKAQMQHEIQQLIVLLFFVTSYTSVPCSWLAVSSACVSFNRAFRATRWDLRQLIPAQISDLLVKLKKKNHGLKPDYLPGISQSVCTFITNNRSIRFLLHTCISCTTHITSKNIPTSPPTGGVSIHILCLSKNQNNTV